MLERRLAGHLQSKHVTLVQTFPAILAEIDRERVFSLPNRA